MYDNDDLEIDTRYSCTVFHNDNVSFIAMST